MADLNLGYSRLIIDRGRFYGLLRNQMAYVLATAYHETAHTMKPVKEGYWLKNAERWRKRNLRYWPWYGRGFVQLTWEDNYIRAGKLLGLDLTTEPDAVMVPDTSAAILVLGSRDGWFTGKKLSDYITLQKSDFVGARRIINGTDKARLIADLAKDYDAALKEDGYGEEPLVVPTPAPAPRRPAVTAVAKDAAATDRISTTELAAGGTAITNTIAAGNKIVEAVEGASTIGDKLIAAGPWAIILVGGLAFAWWIWKERRRKAREAREALA